MVIGFLALEFRIVSQFRTATVVTGRTRRSRAAVVLGRFVRDSDLSRCFGDAGIAGPVPPTASAARLADPAGLAPAWIGCGTADLFHAEAETYATRLAAAGVATRFRSAPGGFHGFATMAPKAETARTYLDDMISTLGEGLGLIPG